MSLKRKESASFSLYDDEDEEEVEKEEPPVKRACEIEVKARTVEAEVVEESKTAASNGAVNVKSRLFAVMGVRRGERAEMQDAHVVMEPFLPSSSDIGASALYAILDGHAGARAARFVESQLPPELRKAITKCGPLSALEKSIKKIFIESYKAIDERFLNEARKNKPVWKDGTTVTTLLVLNDCIYSANVGDSKAIVCRHKPTEGVDVAVELTVDHNPQNFDERTRIAKAGGTVKNGRVDGIIEVSRSIGDGPFKSHGVSCIPDLKKFSITQNDRFIILACDGLWKSFSNDDAISFVWKKLEEAKKREDVVGGGEKAEWAFVAGELAAEAVRRQCGDNVSLLLVKIDFSP